MLLPKQKSAIYKLYFINYRNFLQAFFACITAFSIIGIISQHMRILISISPSLHETYFLHFPSVKPRKGDVTVYAHSGGRQLIKKVLGIAGDRIYYDEDKNLWVEGFKVGKCLPKNSYGCLLDPIQPGVIPKDFVFLFAPHSESLDSRYTKIGLIHQDNLLGKAIALW
jgi:conjugal transfer pilin signal peptidase TrbI